MSIPIFRCQHLDDETYLTGIKVPIGGQQVLHICQQCFDRLRNEDLGRMYSDRLLPLDQQELSVGRMIRVNMGALLEG